LRFSLPRVFLVWSQGRRGLTGGAFQVTLTDGPQLCSMSYYHGPSSTVSGNAVHDDFSKHMFFQSRSGPKYAIALAVSDRAVPLCCRLCIALRCHLMLPLWAVLTSLLVTQMSVGRSLESEPATIILGYHRGRNLCGRHRGAGPAFRRGPFSALLVLVCYATGLLRRH